MSDSRKAGVKPTKGRIIENVRIMEAGARSVVKNKTTCPKWICLSKMEPRITESRLNYSLALRAGILEQSLRKHKL